MTNLTTVSQSIITSGLLTPENCKSLPALQAELTDSWQKRQVYRTETEMRCSVLNDAAFPTLASKYWQSVREQANMLDNLVTNGFDYRRNEVEIRRKQKALAESEDEFEREDLEIDIEECMYRKASMQQVANDRVRELRLWSQIKGELESNGKFDTEDVNTHQLHSMYHQLKAREQALASSNSSQAEVSNVMGPLRTIEKFLSVAK